MPPKSYRKARYYKNPMEGRLTKKISKGVDASGTVSARWRPAPTLTAVPRRGVMAACRDHAHSQHLYTFTPHPPYIRFRNNPFEFKIQDRKSRPLQNFLENRVYIQNVLFIFHS